MPLPRQERLPYRRVLSHLLIMVAVAAVLGVVVAGLVIPFAGIVGVGTRDVASSMDELPAELDTPALPQRTTILDSSGQPIASYFDQNRVDVPLSGVSPMMVKSLLAIEDYRFYQHGALDLKGTLRALITNQANSGVVQGGSSITQQLVKLTLIQNAGSDKQAQRDAITDTYQRKIRELRYAIALEQKHSKDWILERYLNTAYFGDGAYGVQAAARHYFGVNARDLNLVQSATLAGLVKNPTGYDPTNFPDAALERRDVVLDRMAQLQVITPKKAERAKKKDLGLNVQKVDSGCLNSAAPFFCDYVINYLLKDKQLGKTKADRLYLLKNGGLTIKTSLNLADQQAADNAVAAHVYSTDKAVGALAIEEPGTGNVLALAQSRPMGNNKAKGETYINYTVPQELGNSQCCQAGSTFKLFTLATAIEMGLPLTTSFYSPSPLTLNYADYANCPGEPTFGTGTFDAFNEAGFANGTQNMYTGMRLSINTYFMQLEEKTGVCAPYELAQKMGVDLTNPVRSNRGAAERIPFFTLGVASVSPLEMAEAYGTVAARGLHCDSRPVTEIDDNAGHVLKTYNSNCQQVMQQTTADAVNDILRGVTEPGGYAANEALAVPSAGKTGTTDDGKSVWFDGYTPHIVAAAMIGGANEDGTPLGLTGQTVGGQYVSRASGSGFAAPIWGDALRIITEGAPYDDFVYPSTVAGAGVTSVAPPPRPSRPPGRGGGGGGRPGGGGRR